MEKHLVLLWSPSDTEFHVSRGGTGCSCNGVLAIDPDKGGAVNDFFQASTAEEEGLVANHVSMRLFRMSCSCVLCVCT
ncbi:unnamed protein product [Ectocarpus sp. 8 AP-2014]